MAHDLPAPVRIWLAERAEGQQLATLKRQHDSVSRHYRAGGASSGVIDSEAAVLSYALARLPATYAACRAALSALEHRSPEFAPRSVLDLGCGPGTALAAAIASYPDLSSLRGVDHNPHFLRFAGRFLHETGLDAGRVAAFDTGDLSGVLNVAAADLVVCSYALVEVPPADVEGAVNRAWRLATQMLVLVEPGSSAGFERLRSAREHLIAAGAHILAPCAHHAACPMTEGDWCHFPVRLARSREHLRLKGAQVPFEDEKYSYLIAARLSPSTPAAPRIVAPAQHRKGVSRFRLCADGGFSLAEVSAREADYKRLKKLGWGDVLDRGGN